MYVLGERCSRVYFDTTSSTSSCSGKQIIADCEHEALHAEIRSTGKKPTGFWGKLSVGTGLFEKLIRKIRGPKQTSSSGVGYTPTSTTKNSRTNMSIRQKKRKEAKRERKRTSKEYVSQNRKSPKKGPFRMHPFTIRDLTSAEIKLLTQILHRYRMDEESGSQVVDLIDSVPSQLRRSGFLNLMSNRSSRFPAVAPACELHKPLNGHVIRSIFNLIALEVGVRINHLVARSDQFSYAQRAILQSLRELHSMWLEPEVYRNTFLESPLAEWSYQENKCEACMLARIGENSHILACLRTVVLSRTQTKKRQHRPRVTQWLEEWIKCHRDLKEVLFRRSDEDGPALKSAWKEACKRRISHGKSRREANSQADDEFGIMSAWYNGDFENGSGADDETEPADDTAEDQYDYEHEIIDHYEALVSSQYLPLNSQDNNASLQQARSTLIDRSNQPQEARNTRAPNVSQRDDATSAYSPPRQGPGWLNYFRKVQSLKGQADTNRNSSRVPKSSDRGLAVPGSSKSTSISPRKSEKSRSEQTADDYRGLVDSDSKRYSGSVYSREEGDSGKSDVSHATTTWSMMYK